MIKIQNDNLRVQIDPHGAQMHSIKLRNSSSEYLWQGNSNFWDRQAPILFPFVGRLKDDQYEFAGKIYHQTQHGFARDSDFTVVAQSADAVTFRLQDNVQTLLAYPFKFTLDVQYKLIKQTIQVSYKVTNPDQNQDLLYSIGAHPGFHIPLEHDHFEDYQLVMRPAKKYQLSKLVGSYNDLGTVNNDPLDFSKARAVNHQLFKDDVLTLVTQGEPVLIKLWNPENKHGIQLGAKDAQFVGLWSSYPAKGDFVCIEPWWGIADNVNTDGQLIHKQGIHSLDAHQSANYQFVIEIF
ncbi:aldose 1-epimerase family protein [Limosilactobacillus sp.]|uniref:aldose 1-epimerase family protein n=1 Tax=Limosilactobacillus sp. TaxID=2773925 RepID=UPI00345E9F7F